ncbi:SDR family oxidoreductase [Qipengyuania sp. DSG2-2]|uniref:SDR family oxidoreductase n=1 Tax=Qipengyuania sp. DGS2-2 TaxID=3349631 RepID=UPI0036D3AA17
MNSAPKPEKVIVLGAKSLVGEELLAAVQKSRREAIALTRKALPADSEGVRWHDTAQLGELAGAGIPLALCVAHIWVIEEHIPAMKAAGVNRLVALSTTSRFTKQTSSSESEQADWKLFEQSEARVHAACTAAGIGCTILRPTLIWGNGQDKNVTEIARMIGRLGFFPLFGAAKGLRQPIHARDVAAACLQAGASDAAAGKDYNISGGEVLPYRVMVEQIFAALGRKPRTPSVPLPLFALAVKAMRLIPRFRKWTPDMAVRMNQDQDFDHSAAAADFGFAPGPFAPTRADLQLEREGAQT